MTENSEHKMRGPSPVSSQCHRDGSKEAGKSTHAETQCSSTHAEGTHYPRGWRLFLIVLPLCLGTLLVAIDSTIIAVAIPKIASTFRALDQVAWYGSGYLLTVTAFQPTFGKIYKYFDIKLTYMVSIIIFEGKPQLASALYLTNRSRLLVGSVLCAAAPNSSTFILGRVVAGIGAAGLFQGALCIIALSVPLEKRPLFLGIVVSAFGLAACFGPILGGALTKDVTWRWCFWM